MEVVIGDGTTGGSGLETPFLFEDLTDKGTPAGASLGTA